MVVGRSVKVNTTINKMKLKYLGVDIGGTNIKSVVLNENDTIIDKEIISTEDFSINPEKWKNNIIDLVERKTQEFANGEAHKLLCEISAPGLACKENKQIMSMPGRLIGLEKFNWSKHLKRNIFVINDAHSACIAEYESFYKKEVDNMLMLTLGTGVGGAAILNGKLFQGTLQRAGHFGHITIDHMGAPTMTKMVGSLEYAIGNFSIKERTYNKFSSTKDLITAYNNQDPLASYWWLSSIQKLSIGLSSLINTFSPELIILGGGIVEAGSALFEPLKKFMSLYEWRPAQVGVKIKKAKYHNFSGAIGAALFTKNKSIRTK